MMKVVKQTRVLAVILFLCTIFNVAAQENRQDTVGCGRIPAIVEQMPEFPGGDTARLKFIQDNLIYPRIEMSIDIEVKVWIGFVVKADGSLTDFSIVKGVAPVFDDEALRVAKLMPNWIPAKHRGKHVCSYYNMPIIFRIVVDTPQEIKETQKTKKGKR
jgi:TonB family protein